MPDEVGKTEQSVLALDIGGTKIAIGAVSRLGRILRRQQVVSPETDDAEEFFGAAVALLEKFDPFGQYVGLGVGCGGPMAPGGVHVSPLNIRSFHRFPLLQRLQDLTGLPVAIDNDAKALAMAEGWVGAAQGWDSYIAMVVSTGVGGGIVLNGRLLEGDSGNAGHIGHVMVAPSATVAPPEHVPGMLESEASGTGIQVRTGAPAVQASTRDIRRTGMLVGRAVASVANLLDLRLAIVAGSVALGYGEPFFSSAQAEMDRLCVLDHSRGARIRPAGLGADGPLVGAAAVGLRHLGQLPRNF